MKSVLCIFRAACFSPGMVERDEAILRAVASRLQSAGYTVSFIHEEELTADTPMPDITLHMVRSPYALSILTQWEDAGCRVLNPVEGVRNVEREALARLCAEQRIPTPKTWIVDTTNPSTSTVITTEGQHEAITFPCWVKRAGSCAQQPNDVCFASDINAYEQSITRFHARGIDKAVVMEHLDGACIKFYVIQDTGFLHFLPAEKLGYDKFNANCSAYEKREEEHNKGEKAYQLPIAKLCQSLDEAKDLFKLKIYGGDAIIGPDGIARLIDLNDWPSFSACREEAADAIAQLVKMHE